MMTIIILLILAGVTIAQLTGNGLFENAKLAKEKSENAQELENTILADYENKINEYVNGTRDSIVPTLVWTNPSPNTDFSETTINIDLSSYKYVIMVAKNKIDVESVRNAAIICKVEEPSDFYTNYLRGQGTHYFRTVNVWSNSIKIGDCTYPGSNTTVQNSFSIPLYIYGIKEDLDINVVSE